MARVRGSEALASAMRRPNSEGESEHASRTNENELTTISRPTAPSLALTFPPRPVDVVLMTGLCILLSFYLCPPSQTMIFSFSFMMTYELDDA